MVVAGSWGEGLQKVSYGLFLAVSAYYTGIVQLVKIHKAKPLCCMPASELVVFFHPKSKMHSEGRERSVL